MKIFISYSHSPPQDKKWAEKLAEDLKKKSYEVLFDKSETFPNIGVFIESSITSSDVVLCICSDSYVDKAKNSKSGGGVGFETNILTQLILNKTPKKSIPIMRNHKKSLPGHLALLKYVDFTNEENYRINLHTLTSILEKYKEEKEQKERKETEKERIKNYQEHIQNCIKTLIEFNDRFAKTFPGLRGIREYKDKVKVDELLTTFSEAPIPKNLWLLRTRIMD